MIKHTIMIKLKDNSPESKELVKAKLLTMEGRVKMISDLEVHADFLCSERSYDVLLSNVVADEKALEDYQNDEYHCEIKKFVKEVSVSVIAVDAYI